MVRSMTGYGAGEARSGEASVRVEVRAVNHRYFDPVVRINGDRSGLEGRVKDALGGTVSRGRVTATVDVAVASDGAGLVLDEELAQAYLGILETLQKKHRLEGPAEAVAFAQLPDVVRRPNTEAPPEDVAAALDAALQAALKELDSMRSREGAVLGEDLARRARRLEEIGGRIDEASEGASVSARDRLRERIAKLVPEGAAVDPDRLATEVAVLADKADIQEELVRFRAHVQAFVAFLEKEEAVGKRLDFLLQEMNREANTMGAKSVDAGVTHLVVEAKEEIERLREQVQNVE